MKFPTIKSILRELIEFLYLLVGENVTDEDEHQAPLIIGTWITPGKSYASRWVFRKSGTVEKYYKNELYKTYYWKIRETSNPSESTLRDLTLANVNNPDIEIEFQISVLTDKQLILAYSTGLDESQNVFERY